jgi:hypothetical protein
VSPLLFLLTQRGPGKLPPVRSIGCRASPTPRSVSHRRSRSQSDLAGPVKNTYFPQLTAVPSSVTTSSNHVSMEGDDSPQVCVRNADTRRGAARLGSGARQRTDTPVSERYLASVRLSTLVPGPCARNHLHQPLPRWACDSPAAGPHSLTSLGTNRAARAG